jgi:hypothetical protein
MTKAIGSIVADSPSNATKFHPHAIRRLPREIYGDWTLAGQISRVGRVSPADETQSRRCIAVGMIY